MSTPTIFPQPRQVEMADGRFRLDEATAIVADDRDLGELLAAYLRPATGCDLPVQAPDATDAEQVNAIILRLDGRSTADDAYDLKVSAASVDIAAPTVDGLRHGVQTLRQLLPPEIMSRDKVDGVDWEIPAVHISDAPAFGWRGLLLDVARHMFSVAEIKSFIDLMAFYKFNTLHWHLTDDQGWRIEIKKYPRLTEISAFRAETALPTNRNRFDGVAYGGFYTQDEVKDIVSYAARRGITIVPEIEMPGHAVAALSAYPHLGCRGAGYQVRRTWGIAEDIYCAGKDEVFNFLQDVLSEVLQLFPSTFVHIGGDEAPKARWKACPDCQARIRTESLADEDELQSWFVGQMDSWLTARGRRLLGWDEILEGGLAPNATVMSWRGSEGGIEAANAGHDVVMTPTTYCYLDYYQSEDRESEPPALPAYLPLEKVYQFDVVPGDIAPDKRQHILGGQGNIWTEYIPSFQHLQYMAYPRAIAIAEVLWHHPADRDYTQFRARLKRHLPYLDTLNVSYRRLDD